jgi:hypothetical protein
MLLALSGCAALCPIALASSADGAALYTQCPPVYRDSGCEFLITATPSGNTVSRDPGQEPYRGAGGATIGVLNDTSSPLAAIRISAESELFGFGGGGECAPGGAPVPPGCVVQAESPQGAVPPRKPGTECGYAEELRSGKTVSETIEEDCGYPPPAGEPAGQTFPSGVEAAGLGANGDAVSGFEGPTTWFSGIGALGTNAAGAGTINFSPALAPGASTYPGAPPR